MKNAVRDAPTADSCDASNAGADDSIVVKNAIRLTLSCIRARDGANGRPSLCKTEGIHGD